MSSSEMTSGEYLLHRLRKIGGCTDLLPEWASLTEVQKDGFTREAESLISVAFSNATGNLVTIDNLFFDREAEEGRS